MYFEDRDKKLIHPLAPGQRWGVRWIPEGSGVITQVEILDGVKVTVSFEPDAGSPLVRKFTWRDQAAFDEEMAFMGWAKNEPAKIDWSRYPHTCPRCRSKAYVGAGGPAAVDCINTSCPTRSR